MTYLVKFKNFLKYWFGYFPSQEEVYSKQYDPVIISLIRNTMPSILAQDIVGIQPMTGPTSQIFSMRAKYSSNEENK